jgi:filamentous hemagglutinin family protein
MLVSCVSSIAITAAQVTPALADIVASTGTTFVSTIGANTTVTTTNIGVTGVAYNGFSKFEVNTGTSVTLVEPSAARALVNVVNNANGTPSRVDGTLNMQKEGGGQSNVFLLDHNGFVVGADGIINAHKLTMSTVAQSVGAEILNQGISETVLQGGFAPGDLAQSDIEIYGAINAEGLTLQSGARMILDGQITIDAPGQEGTGVPVIINFLGQPEVNRVSVENGAVRSRAGPEVI